MTVHEPTEGATATPGSVTGDLLEARPGLDLATMEDVRARVERDLFGSGELPKLDRFVLLQPISGGGMGLIHRAYDPKLDRSVALKLLHPRLHGTPKARARLEGEARVLAQLAHPNVVPVFDIVTARDQIVLVMELVQGQTLGEWASERPRGWRAIVEVYAQAGRGLAAAHALGIVHRDFKPANAIVGTDGRVRVLDFGLARFSAEASAEAPPATSPGLTSEPGGSDAAPLTADGELLGTLAYMSPEQLSGHAATPASDQFSFCVALYRVLCGAPPFPGTDAPSLRAAIAKQQLAPPPPDQRLPKWLLQALRQGLAVDPARRHASMQALCDELTRDRSRRRLRWAALSSAIALVTACVAFFSARSDRELLSACDGGLEEAGKVWNPAGVARIRARLASVATPYSSLVGDHVVQTLQRYRDTWSATHRDACREYRSVRLSSDRFDRRMQCLSARLEDLANAVAVLEEINEHTITKAVDVAALLPAIERCAQTDTLPRPGPPDASPAVRAAIADLRAQVSRANALERGGRAQEAVALASRALDAANELKDPAVIAEIALAKGRIQVLSFDLQGALEPLALAERLALERGELGTAVIAGARRVYAEGILGVNPERLVGRVELLEALSRAVDTDPVARPLLLNYAGVAFMARADRSNAQNKFEAAQTARGEAGSDDLELNAIDMNLAMVTPDRARRESLARSAWQRYQAKLGASHVQTLRAQCDYAHSVADPIEAMALLRESHDLFLKYHPEVVSERALCAAYLSFLTIDSDAPDAARLAAALDDEVAQMAEGSSDPDTIHRAHLARGAAALSRNTPHRALAEFEVVLVELASSPYWWDQQLVAEARLGLGASERALAASGQQAQHLARAKLHLEEAIAGYGRLVDLNEDAELRQRLAAARVELAQVLQGLGTVEAAARARELAEAAAQFYTQTNPTAYRHKLNTLNVSVRRGEP